MIRLQRTVLLLIAGSTLVSCGSAAKSSLQMNLAPQSSYRLSIRSDGLISVGGNESDRPAPFSVELVLVLRAMQVYENGDTGVAVTFERTRMQVIAGAVEGATFSARISPRGRIVEVDGLEAIRDRILPTLTKDPSNIFSDPLFVIQQLSDTTILGTINTVFAIWPDSAVAPGDTWTREPLIEPNLKNYEHTKFELFSIHHSDARIEFTSEIRKGPNPSDARVGSSSGEIHVAPGLGILRSYRAETTIDYKDESSGTSLKLDSTTYATFAPL